MQTETRNVETPDGEMPVYVAHPDEQPSRAVIVIQEAFGVNDHIQDVTRRAAQAGYLAVAPHIFHRSGGGVVAYGDMEAVMSHFKVLGDKAFLQDLDATLGLIHGEGISDGSIGITGFCIGGRMTFLAAAERPLGAAVSYYGGGIVPSRSEAMPSLLGAVPHLRAPWLGFFGELDKGIPLEEVEQLRDALKAAPVEHEIVLYANAGHGFNRDPAPEAYQPEAAADAWKRALAWFGDHLA